jgi:hypothetical protein
MQEEFEYIIGVTRAVHRRRKEKRVCKYKRSNQGPYPEERKTPRV